MNKPSDSIEQSGSSGCSSSLVLDVVRALRDQDGELIEGEVALSIARLLHACGLDSQGQWGNAYFRCPNCDDARDLNGEEDWSSHCVAMCECEWELHAKDVRLSEGWVERL